MLDLTNDRLIENSFIINNLPNYSVVLDIGANGSDLSYIAASFHNTVTSVDLAFKSTLKHPSIFYMHADVLRSKFTQHFDFIILCSTIEHVGLEGRYNSPCYHDGDKDLMQLCKSLLNPSGNIAITLPVGIGGSFFPYHRVYDKERLSSIFTDYSIMKNEYFSKNSDSTWVSVSADEAFATQGSKDYYAIGCFILSLTNRKKT